MDNYVILELISSSDRNYQERIRLENLRDHSNPFEMPEDKFQKLFRLPRSGAYRLLVDLNDQRLNEGTIPKYIKILSALQFFAQGSYQAAVGQDTFISMSQPSVSRCIKLTSDVIVETLVHNTIKFPISDREKLAAMTDFQEMFNMPNTLGAVDGTHIAIAKPKIHHPTAPANLFYNRKRFYSINCQIICSAKGKIIGLNPNFPGSTHDAAIWRASNVNNLLKNEFLRGERNQWLLGDKGYPLEPWVMTPLLEPTSEAERAYNVCHARARNVVELCNGRLKNKFRCLHRHRCLHYQPERAAKIILSCCILFNLFADAFSDDNDYEAETEDPSQEIDVIGEFGEDEHQDFLAEARAIRAELIRRHFSIPNV